MDVLVVGAGALGTAAAYHLGASGHRVTLLDAGGVAGETTGLAAGILSLGVVHDHDRRLVRMTLEGLDRLDKEHPTPGADVGPLLRRPDSHLLASTYGPEARLVDAIAADVASLGRPHAFLRPDEWQAEMEARGVPALVDGVGRVLSLPGDAWAIGTEATNLMARAAKAHGVRIRTNLRAARLDMDTRPSDAGRVLAVGGVRLDDGTRLAADHVVLALGAWTRTFLAAHGLRLPAQCFRTHAATLATPAAPHMPMLHDNPKGYYLRPEGPNHLLVGNGTRTEAITPEDFTNEPEPEFMASIAERLPSRFPTLASAGFVRAWRGILTGTPDRAPLLGPHPDAERLSVLTGGNGFGFMRSYALGAALAASVDGTGPPDGLPPDLLGRFALARFWPDPPEAFVVREGFTLEP